jgi:2-keto-4-pentenoate hydratase/2-oxohepta-3-ene-1,7-dioic acid hydratase in catechol pathway
MAAYALSTLNVGSEGLQAAITIDNRHYLLSKVETSPTFGEISVKGLLQDWQQSKLRLQTLADKIHNDPGSFTKAVVTDFVMETPIRYPNKLLAVGANYAGHLKEMGLPAEKWEPMPFFCCPPSTSMVGPGETLKYPAGTSQFDWECELVVVAGARLRDATLDEASAAIAGYTIGLDMSCRDLMTPQNGGLIDLLRGKAQDAMKPCGPSFVPRTASFDHHGLSVKLSVNGEEMINDTTADMISTPEECLVEISKVITIESGDMILTGSPAGSAKARGGKWLKVGDQISAQISGLGTLNVAVV